MAGIKIVDLPALGRDLLSTDLFEMSIGGTASRKITGQEIINASKLNVGSTSIVSGTVGRVLFQGTGNVLQQSANLFWDNTNGRLGIGTNTPLGILHLKETATTTRMVMDGDAGQSKIITFRTNGLQRFGFYLNNIAESGGNAGSNFAVRAYNDAGSLLSTPLYIHRNSGNVLINTTTDAGFKLDVNGTLRVNARLEVNSVNSTQGILLKHFALATTATQIYYNSPDAVTYFDTLYNYAASTGLGSYNFRTKNSGNVLTSRLFIQGWNGSIGIGTTTPAATLDVNGTARVQGTITGLVPNGVSSLNLTNAAADSTFTNVISSTWSRTSFSSQSVSGVFWANPQSTPQSGFVSGVGYGTNGSGFNVNIGQFNTGNNGGGVNYYAQNNGSNFGHKWFYNGTEIMRIPTTGNVLINTTTDAGFRLDVNGTARVSGRMEIQNSSGLNIRTTVGAVSTAFRPSGNDAELRTNDASVACAYFYQNGNVGFSQRVVFGSTTLNASAQLQIDSTTRGFLPPRMTNAQRTAIVSPAVGLIVYCTDVTEGLWIYKSLGWTFIV